VSVCAEHGAVACLKQPLATEYKTNMHNIQHRNCGSGYLKP